MHWQNGSGEAGGDRDRDVGYEYSSDSVVSVRIERG